MNTRTRRPRAGRHARWTIRQGIVLNPFIWAGALLLALTFAWTPTASAHTPGHSATCDGVTASAANYAHGATVTVDVEGGGIATKHVDHDGTVTVPVPSDGSTHAWTASVTANSPSEHSQKWTGVVGPCGSSPSPTPTPTETPSVTPTPTPTPTATPTPSETPSPSPTPSESPTPSPSASPTPTPSPSPTPTPPKPTPTGYVCCAVHTETPHPAPPTHGTPAPRRHKAVLPNTGAGDLSWPLRGAIAALFGAGSLLWTRRRLT